MPLTRITYYLANLVGAQRDADAEAGSADERRNSDVAEDAGAAKQRRGRRGRGRKR